MSDPAAAPSPWIVNPRYDLAWFFGGAFVSLVILALYLSGTPVLVLWWTWILLLDGPHIAAAFTRTYLDREEWARRRSVLLGSLLAFAVGPACLFLNLALGSPDPFLLFLALSAFYGYYHVVRQHYGFLALYQARSGARDRAAFRLERWILYVGCWAPYFYFLLTHPRARAMLRLSPEPGGGWFESLLRAALIAVWGAAVLTLLARATTGAATRPKTAYLLITLALYSVFYYGVARLEPTYGASNGPDQDFLLLSALVTAFHNVQYLGLVWFYNRNRYRGPGAFGAAGWLNSTPVFYAGGCLLFSLAVYASFACSTGVFPGCMILPDIRVGPFTANQIGLSLWWGLAIHHYWLDQRIWRVRTDADLRRNLGFA